MESCEVLVIGAGPAGSTCAARLAAAGLDVLLLDQSVFPRSKPCAGWITPPVLARLGIEPHEYRQGRILETIRAFRTALIDGPEIETRYEEVVSYGIVRSEFDHYLLQRCHARQRFGEKVESLEGRDNGWLVNGRISARLVVGAGGHLCPVARHLGARIGREPVVAAQVAEQIMTAEEESQCTVAPDTPLIHFCRDLQGYGWLLRKGRRLNVGLGRRDPQDLSRHVLEFCASLKARGALPAIFSAAFQGHAYRLCDRRNRRDVVGGGALLIGDAAGLAGVHSGEGILPAIESALLAAEIIDAARGDYRRERLQPYAAALRRDWAGTPLFLPFDLARHLGDRVLSSPFLTRHLLLNRWFLHAVR